MPTPRIVSNVESLLVCGIYAVVSGDTFLLDAQVDFFLHCPIKKRDLVRFTLTLQKPRVLQMQGVKGEAVVVYADPLTTQQMLYHRLSRRVNNMA
ncbi:MAG: hypothetical protein JW883_09290 [Deltaproteobacteria bacterium]|nr:hypothetical protein [Deltaproteobacteria bacterium]